MFFLVFFFVFVEMSGKISSQCILRRALAFFCCHLQMTSLEKLGLLKYWCDELKVSHVVLMTT